MTNVIFNISMSKAEMITFLHERFAVPVGSARRMNKFQLMETYQGCVNNETVHEVIARQASKASV